VDRISGTTRVAAVIGDPVRHSLSPVIHNAAFAATGLDWVYLALPVVDGEAEGALAGMRSFGFDGLSVTMPHKSAVAALVDSLSPAAAALEAVNCVVRDGSRLHGENTDGPGFLDALVEESGYDPAGSSCVVMGAGGAARAVIVALAEAGADSVVVLNRSAVAAEGAASLAGSRGRTGVADDIGAADLVVQATPLGMTGHLSSVAPFDFTLLRPDQLIAELIYQPAMTPLRQHCERNGMAHVGGVGMLIHQAAHAFTLWTGLDAPVPAMRAAAMTELASRSE